MNIEQLLAKINDTRYMKEKNCMISDDYTDGLRLTFRAPLRSLAKYDEFIEVAELFEHRFGWECIGMQYHLGLPRNDNYIDGMNDQNYDILVKTSKYLSMIALV
jgi:hypothetical protein